MTGSWTGSRKSRHLARRRSGVNRLPAIDLIAGCSTSLPLKPLRSPDQNDNLFEKRSRQKRVYRLDVIWNWDVAFGGWGEFALGTMRILNLLLLVLLSLGIVSCQELQADVSGKGLGKLALDQKAVVVL